jgi:hypothetical protein
LYVFTTGQNKKVNKLKKELAEGERKQKQFDFYKSVTRFEFCGLP